MNKRPKHKTVKETALAIPAVRKEYELLEEEYLLIGELVRARKTAGKTQKEVAKLMNTSASVISRLEAGYGKKSHLPSMETLRKYANAVGCQILVKLVPRKKKIA